MAAKCRILTVAIAVGLRLASAVAVLAFCATAFGVTALSLTDPSLQGTVIASQTVPIFSFYQDVFPDPELLVEEKVVQTTAGTLDFYYKILNPPNQSTTVMDFGVEFPLSNALQLDIAYLDEGNPAPSSAKVMSIGGTADVSYHFGPDLEIQGVLLPDAGSDWLLLRSNASAYIIGTVGAERAIDDPITPAAAFAPDANSVPEPNALALLSVGIMGLAIKFRRRKFLSQELG